MALKDLLGHAQEHCEGDGSDPRDAEPRNNRCQRLAVRQRAIQGGGVRESRYGDGQLLPWQPGTVKEIEAAPAEHQLQAVMEKLQQLNPGFDGHEAHKIEGGVVTELEISSLKLSDISPAAHTRKD